MKRRNFVRNAAWSAFGLPLVSTLPVSWWSPTCAVQQWLRQFMEAGSVKTYRENGNFQPLLAPFIQQGYVRESHTVHTYQAGDSCCSFYPLFLRHATAGITDLLVPVFAQNDQGAWQHFTTLHSYQLEALATAGTALGGDRGLLQKVLLPVPGNKSRWPDGGFDTLNGHCSILTRLQPGGTSTSIEVISRHQPLFRATFVSRHGLRCGQVAI